MARLGTISFAFCSMVSWCLGGCVVVIPTIPLNAPGYGHTYQVVDQHDRPIKDGFLILHSFYRANEEIRNLLLRHGADPKLGDQPTTQPAR